LSNNPEERSSQLLSLKLRLVSRSEQAQRHVQNTTQGTCGRFHP